MDQNTAAALLEENLQTIFSYCLTRLYDRSEAEDLAQDILYEVLRSAHRLRDDEAFYGFMWRIAENVFRAHLRRKKTERVAFDERFVGYCYETPETRLLENEQLHLLRRELSLCSKQHRETTVLYYIYGKTCAEIAATLGISREMVKYYLFRTRKILKEGIDMTREYGERSYNPARFCCDFWGGWNTYWSLFKRKLPGNIVLAAYERPLTVSELSVELGVSAPYLEDELDILTENWLVKKIGDKYRTDMVIFKRETLQALKKELTPIYRPYAKRIAKRFSETSEAFARLDFEGNNADENTVKWLMATLTGYFAMLRAFEESAEKYGDYPTLSNGTNGFVYGYDFDAYDERRFNGISLEIPYYQNEAFVSYYNYRIIERCQNVDMGGASVFYNRAAALHDVILHKRASAQNDQIVPLIEEGYLSSEDGVLSARFPVFTKNVLQNGAKSLLAPAVEETIRCMDEICERAIERIRPSIPSNLRDRCDYVTRINFLIETIACLVESMVEEGALKVPNERANLCMFGVDCRKE
ncbi:MAG: sigma-70 family RNA polymerase sigma factor [Bacteroides sp.]|nr:sigma-70 family RNA polymerase sigma factor [Eubacterium sp.]MCM1419768.1 sigma-70 family RNA polymerase sigma factor [Roseburia sp.]MCM1461959.1 sigma-70 family RNA polymerase sigma factor [Bacteroides sp.]